MTCPNAAPHPSFACSRDVWDVRAIGMGRRPVTRGPGEGLRNQWLGQRHGTCGTCGTTTRGCACVLICSGVWGGGFS